MVDETLTFPAGSTASQTIDVTTTNDSVYEGNETFTVRLSNATKGDAGSTTPSATERSPTTTPAPTLSIADATVEEGERAHFEVTLSGERSVTVTVHYETEDGTAVAPADYAKQGTLTFGPSDDSRTIEVITRDDTADEEDTETFAVKLSSPDHPTLGEPVGTGTITDDDDPPELSIRDAPAVTEGDTALFPVRLNVASGKMVTVMYHTMDGTAMAGSDWDYMETSGELEFEPGTTRLTIAVPTSDDDAYEEEEEENFTVELSAPNQATLKDGADTGKERSGTTTTRSICRSRTRKRLSRAAPPCSR